MRQNYISIILGVIFISCLTTKLPFEIQERMTINYTGNKNNIDSLIDINGYYSIFDVKNPKLNISLVYSKGKLSTNILFFEDGTLVYGFFDYDDNIQKLISSASVSQNNGEPHFFFKSFYWGNYKIESDTIKAQLINNPSKMSATWMPFEIWFKATDKELKVIASRSLFYDQMNQDKSKMDYLYLNDNEQIRLKFTELDSIPNSEPWLKNEKWYLSR